MKLGLSYTAGRVCAVVTRPLCLFFANNVLEPTAAQSLAVVFLANALALVSIAADPHRRFYARLFDPIVKVNGHSAYLYFASLGILALVGYAVVFAISWHFTHLGWLAAVAGFYFLTEKLMDEVLRLRLFEQRFGHWGALNMRRSTLQLGALALVYLGFGSHAAIWQVVLALTVGNLLAGWPQLPRGISQAFLTHRLATTAWLMGRAGRSLARNWILWLITLASASVSYLDRLVALVLEKASLPVFMLVVMCFSVVQMGVDFFYVSRHRRDFLEGRISVGSALASGHLARVLGVCLGVAILSCVAVLTTARNGGAFPLAYVVVIALLQIAVALTQVPREIVYWGHAFHRILGVETAFWVLFFAGAATGHLLGMPPLATFVSAVASAVARLIVFVAAARSSPSGRATDMGTGTA